YVVETEPLAQLDRGRITAVFPADPQLDSWIDLSGVSNRDLDERSHTVGLQAGERADRKQLPLDVLCKQLALDVVAEETVVQLRQIVRAEREELGEAGQLAGDQGRARRLHHR